MANGINPHGLKTQAAPITTVDQENRTVEVVFSSGALVPHWVAHDGQVRRMQTRVVVEDGACDMEFLRASGPVLDSHGTWDSRSVVGVVEDAWIENGEARARLRFSEAESAADIWQKVSEGTLRNVSAGFEVIAQEISVENVEGGEPIEVMRFTQWRPMEISMVAIPADRGSRTQALGSAETPPCADAEAHQQAAPANATGMEGDHPMPNDNAGAAQQVPETLAQEASLDDIRKQERARISEIQKDGKALKVAPDVIQKAIDDGTEAAIFRKQAVDEFATRSQESTAGIGGPRVAVTQSANDKFRQGAQLALMARVGLEGGEHNEFTSLTLAEMARQSLDIAGRRGFSSRLDMVGAAFTQAGAHGTSDFANVLSSVMGKGVLLGWSEADETYEKWTRAGVLTDFKETKRVGLGLMDALPKLPESGEYKFGTVGDRGETVVLATYGRMLRITRQSIINDDLSLFTSLPRLAGRAARRTVGDLAYGVLTDNAAMSDGTALFHANHNNLAASGGAPSVATLGAARAAMRTQVEKAGGAALNIRPKYMLVPAALETSTQQLLTSIVDPTANKGHASNPVAGMAELVVEGRLDGASATAWYLAADPNAFDTVEISYLDGVQEPFIEEMTEWNTDGVALKVRMDAAAKALEHRTLYKNAGA